MKLVIRSTLLKQNLRAKLRAQMLILDLAEDMLVNGMSECQMELHIMERAMQIAGIRGIRRHG